LTTGLVYIMRSAASTLLIIAVALAISACGRSEAPVAPPDATPPPAAPAAAAATEGPDAGLAAVAGDEAGAPPPAGGAFSFEAYAYRCGELAVTVRPGADELILVLPERSITLPQVEAASGAKYEYGDVVFWGKGINTAMLILGDEVIECLLDRRETPWVDAAARGAVFRAIGQEPGWHLEIHAERIVLVHGYGDARAVVPNPGALVDPAQPLRRWRAVTEAHVLAVTVEDRPCTDVMSGDVLPAVVTVELDDSRFTGCGRDLF
jgi:membrane-bound inhibitor of C-type lysozyme/uncharacterized membrane protein